MISDGAGDAGQGQHPPREGTYGSAAVEYRAAGWPGVFPLPVGEKSPPPAGFTGQDGVDPDAATIAAWGADARGSNIGLRMPATVVGFDVDAYGTKRGAETLAECVRRWGPLPATWSSTSRGAGSSRIWFFRLPDGVVSDAWPSQLGPDVEIIRRSHRYAVVEPSTHPGGGTYRWYTPSGERSTCLPRPEGLRVLPLAWARGLTERGGSSDGHVGPAPSTSGRADTRNARRAAKGWMARLTKGEPCTVVGELLAEAKEAAGRGYGSAHDNTRDAVGALLRAGDTGHVGVSAALEVVRSVFIATVSDRQPLSLAKAEFDNLTADLALVIISDPSERSGSGCDCPPVVSLDPVMPRPLERSQRLPSFPAGALPGWLAAMVLETARFTQTPVDLSAAVALGVLSTCAGGRVQVQVRPGWIEPTNLYIVVAMPPGPGSPRSSTP